MGLPCVKLKLIHLSNHFQSVFLGLQWSLPGTMECLQTDRVGKWKGGPVVSQTKWEEGHQKPQPAHRAIALQEARPGGVLEASFTIIMAKDKPISMIVQTQLLIQE